jgi:hypothetical protein
MPEFFLNYKLPEGSDEGAQMDRMDVNIYVQRKYFNLNFPESCDVNFLIIKSNQFLFRTWTNSFTTVENYSSGSIFTKLN